MAFLPPLPTRLGSTAVVLRSIAAALELARAETASVMRDLAFGAIHIIARRDRIAADAGCK